MLITLRWIIEPRVNPAYDLTSNKKLAQNSHSGVIMKRDNRTWRPTEDFHLQKEKKTSSL